jgi:hypothetical protein
VGGTNNLARAAAVYIACVAFALTYLLTCAFGADGLSALFRAGVVAAIALVLGRGLVGPALSCVLVAMARDQSRTPKGTEHPE